VVGSFLALLPSELITFLENHFENILSSDLKQELFQATWQLLLNDAFVKAHKEGMDTFCGDGIQ
jgi:hypothetical protein